MIRGQYLTGKNMAYYDDLIPGGGTTTDAPKGGKSVGYFDDLIPAPTPEPPAEIPKPSFFSDQRVGGIAKNTVTGIPSHIKEGLGNVWDVVKGTPRVLKNIAETGLTKEGREAVGTTLKEVGIPSVRNIVHNYNELFYSKVGAKKSAAQQGLLADKANKEIQDFIGSRPDLYDPTDQRGFLEKISSKDGEIEVAKIIGAQLPILGTIAGIAVVGKGFGIPTIMGALGPSFIFNTGDSYQQSKDYYAGLGREPTPDEEKFSQNIALLVGMTTAPLDAFSTSRILTPSASKAVQKTFSTHLTHFLTTAGKDTLMEAGTEGAQEVIQNAWARTYNEHQDLFEGAPEAAFGGGLFGAGMSIVGGVVTPIKETTPVIAEKTTTPTAPLPAVPTPVEKPAPTPAPEPTVVPKPPVTPTPTPTPAPVVKPAPKEEPIKITHFTKSENIDKILSEGFDTSLPPIHGVGGKQGGVRTEKIGKDILYFTADTARWKTAFVYTGGGKVETYKLGMKPGPNDEVRYNYDRQKYEIERDAMTKVDLSPIEAEIKKDASILIIDSLKSAKTYLGKNIDRNTFVEDLITKAKKAGTDILNIKDTGVWDEPGGDPTKTGFSVLTGKGGKNDYFVLNKDAIKISKPTQKEQVKKTVSEEPKGIKEIAKETNIKEPNIRRILGVGEKEGTFERVDKGVYVLKKDGQDIAYIETADALEAIPRLAEEGFEADMIFLDIPYKTPAITGGNRGVKYDLIHAYQFEDLLQSIRQIARDKDTPIIYMYSQAKSGLAAMNDYTTLFEKLDFIPIGRGEYTKLQKDGVTRVRNMRGNIIEPEGIIVFNQSGKFDPNIKDLNFKLVRPRGYQTEKPAEMLKKMIEMTTEEGDVVFDPFAGSGVTGAEAVKLGRKPTLIEKKPKVVEEVIKPRLEKAVKDIPKGQPKKLSIKPEKPTKEVIKDEKKPYSTAKLQPVAKIKGKKVVTPPVLITKSGIKTTVKAMGGEVDFVFDGEYLTFKDAKTDMKLRASAFGLVKENLTKGQVISITSQDLKAPGTSFRVKDEKGTTLASESEGYTPAFERKPGTLPEQKINPIEIPELVDLARDLMGKVPDIVKKTGKARGRFIYGPKGIQIKIIAKLFAQGNLRDASVTLAHEIGHLIDWIPTGTIKRGNVINRLKDIRGMLKKTFGDKEQVTDKVIRNELLEVTQVLHPYNPDISPPSYVRYRRSAVELYAEAVSMLFNSPGLLQEMAPHFYEQFFNALDANPKVKDTYFELQSLLSGTKEQLVKHRRAGVLGMFKEGEYKAQELQNKKLEEERVTKRNYSANLKYLLLTTSQPIINRIKALQKKGVVINPDDNPIYTLEASNYLGGKIKALLEKNVQSTYLNLENADIPWHTFGEVLYYERVMGGDRSDLANPRGLTPEATIELYDDVMKRLSPEQRTIITKSANDFRSFLKRVVQEMFDEGMITPEQYKSAMENPKYTTFQVIEHMESQIDAKLHGQIGTFKDITNPADASVLKVIAMVRDIERKKAARDTIDSLKPYYPDEIRKAKTVFTGKTRTIVSPKDNTDVVVVMRKGKSDGYYVDPLIAASIRKDTIGQVKAITMMMKPLGMLNRLILRPAFIGLNLGFQAFNLFRDFFRGWKNTPGLTIAGAVRRYIQSIPEARVRGFGLPKNPTARQQEAFDLIQKLEEQQVLSVTFSDLIAGGSLDEVQQIDSILQKTGIESFKKQDPRVYLKPVLPVLEFIQNLGSSIETISKIAGYYEISNSGKNELTTEQRSYLRKNLGSPDFLAGGYLKPVSNEVFLFSNAIIHGVHSDYEVATQPTTRSGYWWKTAKLNLLPKVMMWIAALGLFGKELEEMMDDASEYDKTNYTILPLGSEGNKTVYLRVPQDEMGRILGGVFWKILSKFDSQSNTKVTEDVSQLLSFLGGQVPGMTPGISTAWDIKTYLQGHNPYDSYRNRSVLTEQEWSYRYAPRGESSFLEHYFLRNYANKAMLKYTWQQMGGGLFYKFDSGPPRTKGPTEKVMSFPVLGNVWGRFVKVGNYGEVEQLRQVQGVPRQEAAREQLDDRYAVNKAVKAAIDVGATTREERKPFQEQMLIDVFGSRQIKIEDKDRANTLLKNFRLTLARGTSDPAVGVLISSGSNAEKIAIMKDLRSRMTLEDYIEFAKVALREGVISVEVINKASKQQE